MTETEAGIKCWCFIYEVQSEGIDSEGEERRKFGWQVTQGDIVCVLATASR